MFCFVFQVLNEEITPALQKLKEVWKNKSGRALKVLKKYFQLPWTSMWLLKQ